MNGNRRDSQPTSSVAGEMTHGSRASRPYPSMRRNFQVKSKIYFRILRGGVEQSIFGVFFRPLANLGIGLPYALVDGSKLGAGARLIPLLSFKSLGRCYLLRALRRTGARVRRSRPNFRSRRSFKEWMDNGASSSARREWAPPKLVGAGRGRLS